MKYLILRGEEAQKHYRLISYRRRCKNYKELEEIGGIGQVMIDKYNNALSIDGFTLNDFEAENLKKKGRKWELDGIDASEQFLDWAERTDERDRFAEHKRINKLIIQYILKNYEKNPEKYLYG